MKQAPAEIAKRCEQAFQNGASRVLIVTDRTVRSSCYGAATTARLAADEETVYARLKVRGQRTYSWFLVPAP